VTSSQNTGPRYVICRDHGKWFVYDNQEKKRIGDWWDGTTKEIARERAAELNKGESR
jgi:hypothetical protein